MKPEKHVLVECSDRIPLSPMYDPRPSEVFAVGNLEVLSTPKLALFCSRQCPGDIILRAFEVARALRERGVTVISGFHSPVEQDILEVLLRGSQPIIICPARSLAQMRIHQAWRIALDQQRLLLLSPFEERSVQISARFARQRNEFVAALADRILFIHAAPNSETESLARFLTRSGKPLLSLGKDDDKVFDGMKDLDLFKSPSRTDGRPFAE